MLCHCWVLFATKKKWSGYCNIPFCPEWNRSRPVKVLCVFDDFWVINTKAKNWWISLIFHLWLQHTTNPKYFSTVILCFWLFSATLSFEMLRGHISALLAKLHGEKYCSWLRAKIQNGLGRAYQCPHAPRPCPGDGFSDLRSAHCLILACSTSVVFRNQTSYQASLWDDVECCHSKKQGAYIY